MENGAGTGASVGYMLGRDGEQLEGEEDGRQGERRRACRCERDDDGPCLLQCSGVSATEREEGGSGGGQSSLTLDQHMHCLGPWASPGTASTRIF